MAKYWFARRFPVAEVKNTRMAPVSSEGWAVVGLFVGCLVAGALGLITFSFGYREPFVGVLTLLVFTAIGATAFVWLTYAKGDRHHTIEDYKSGRVRQS